MRQTAPSLKRRAWAEALGTFCMVFMGCGSIMVSERFPGSLAPNAIALAFGLSVTVMIYALGHLSGAHFNPAVTLGFSAAGKFPRRELSIYWASQFFGAIAASALLGLLLPKSPGYGAALPKIGLLQTLGWEFILTFFLMFVIMAVATDSRAQGSLAGLAIGATVSLDALVGGPVTGASMNPARSLAPMLFEGHLEFLWVYFVGPAAGAVAAAKAYERLR